MLRTGEADPVVPIERPGLRVGGLVQQSVGFLLIPVYTRHIPPSEYGLLELLMAFLSVTMICGTLGLTSAVNKVYHRDCDTPEERHAVVGKAVLTSLPMFVAVGGLLMILAGPIAGVLTGSVANRGLLRIAVASSICYSIFAMVIAGLRAEERVAAYCVVSAVQFALALTLNLVLVLVPGSACRVCSWGTWWPTYRHWRWPS